LAVGKEGRVAPADAAALASIASHLSFDGTTVANAVIPASTKVAVAPLASGGRGAVAVQGTDGHLQSSGVTATADGALLASSLGPAEGAKAVMITSAELTDPVVTGGTIAQAKSVATATLEVRLWPLYKLSYLFASLHVMRMNASHPPFLSPSSLRRPFFVSYPAPHFCLCTFLLLCTRRPR